MKKMNGKIKKKIQKRIAESMKVDDLVKHLQKMPQDALVGVIGHFGDFHPMDDDNFHYCGSLYKNMYIHKEDDGWISENRIYLDSVLDIHCPDIGDDPD